MQFQKHGEDLRGFWSLHYPSARPQSPNRPHPEQDADFSFFKFQWLDPLAVMEGKPTTQYPGILIGSLSCSSPTAVPLVPDTHWRSHCRYPLAGTTNALDVRCVAGLVEASSLRSLLNDLEVTTRARAAVCSSSAACLQQSREQAIRGFRNGHAHGCLWMTHLAVTHQRAHASQRSRGLLLALQLPPFVHLPLSAWCTVPRARWQAA